MLPHFILIKQLNLLLSSQIKMALMLIGNYSYDSLVLMAKNDQFLGSGYQSDIVQKVQLISPNGAITLNSTVSSKDPKIIIDGFGNYLSITIPPNSFGFFQMFPSLEE